MNFIQNILILLLSITVFTYLIWLIINYLKHRNSKNLKLDIFLVKIPQYSDKEKEQLSQDYIDKELGRIEGLFIALSALKADKHWFKPREDMFSFEIVVKENIISFYIAVAHKHKDFLIQQLQAVYTKVHFEEVTDYNIFDVNSKISAGSLQFVKDFSLPIKTYKTLENDPLEGITNSLSKLKKDESAAIQYVFRSAPKIWHSRGIKISKEMNQGLSFKDASKKVGNKGFLNSLEKLFSFLISIFTTSSNKPEEKKEEVKQLSSMEQETAKLMEEKTSKPGLDVNIRVIVSTSDKERSNNVIKDILNSYSQYNIYEFGNSFKANIAKKPNKLINDYIYRQYKPRNSILLNSEEMTSVIHLPLETTSTPGIDWLDSAKAPLPTNIPTEGLLLGQNTYRNQKKQVFIKTEDRRRHMYIVGMTGTGKSYFASSLAMQDIKAGHGVCYIDPHGDDLEEILARVPKERAEDVIFFDPSDTDRPIGLNLLEFKTEEQKTFAINEIMAIFDKLYDLKATGGPMFEQYFKNAAGLIMSDPESGSTLMEISRVLADEEFRKYKLSKCTDYTIKDFWEKEAQKAGGDASLANMVPYITSKMSPFLSNNYVRPIVSQQNSTIDFDDILNNKKILLIKLAKGKIGDINADLLGMVVIGKILMAALARGDMNPEERKDFYLYIDEFQNFLTDSIEVILSEARKYKLNLIIAHQYLGQLIKHGDTKFKDAIFGNVGTKISFRIGVDDAEILTKEFAPVFGEYDFLNVPKFNCFVKLLIDNANPPPFNMGSYPHDELPINKKNIELSKTIKELSRLKYGKDKKIIENEIAKRRSI